MDPLPDPDREILPNVEEEGEDPRAVFSRQLLAEACLAVARDMECYDYQIGRLIRKVSTVLTENPSWAEDEEYLLRFIRSAAAGFGGRRETVWTASFDSSTEAVALRRPQRAGGRIPRRRQSA